MSKLDDILADLVDFHEPPLKRQIKVLMLELIGNPELIPNKSLIQQGIAQERNQLRTELRKKVTEL